MARAHSKSFCRLVIGIQVDGIPLLHITPCVLPVPGADVDIEVLVLDIALRHCLVQNHHTGDLPLTIIDHDLVTGVRTGMNAARLGHFQKAIRADMGDNQADLINMTCQQHLEVRLRIQHANNIACAVPADFMGIGCHMGNDLLLQADLIAGHRHGIQHFKQKRFVHGFSLL